MVGLSLHYADGLTVKLAIDVPDPKAIELYHDAMAQHETQMRVEIPHGALRLEVNGRREEGLLHSGKAVGTPGGAALLYFPPASAVHPGDASDGGRETEGCASQQGGGQSRAAPQETSGPGLPAHSWAASETEGRCIPPPAPRLASRAHVCGPP